MLKLSILAAIICGITAQQPNINSLDYSSIAKQLEALSLNRPIPVPRFDPQNPGASINYNNPGLSAVNYNVPIPGVNYNAQVPAINYNPQVPAINYNPQVPQINYNAPAPTINYNAPTPAINYNTPVPPAINYNAQVPAINYNAQAPAINYNAQAPAINYNAPVPAINYPTLPATYQTNPQYNQPPFTAGVIDYAYNDPKNGNQYKQIEKTENGVTLGSYTVVEKDGSKRTVTYTADALNGFRANVNGANTFPVGNTINTVQPAPEDPVAAAEKARALADREKALAKHARQLAKHAAQTAYQQGANQLNAV